MDTTNLNFSLNNLYNNSEILNIMKHNMICVYLSKLFNPEMFIEN